MSTSYMTSTVPTPGPAADIRSEVVLCNKLTCAVNATAISTPRNVAQALGLWGQSKRKGKLEVHRIEGGAVDAGETLCGGTAAIYGMDLVNPEVNGYGPAVRTTSTPTRTRPSGYGFTDVERFCLTTAAATVTTTRLTYSSFSNYNWIIRVQKTGLVTKEGTVSLVAGSTSVAGSSTKFDQQLLPGMRIVTAGGYTYEVESITSATALTLTKPAAASETTVAFQGPEVQILTYNASTAAATYDDTFKVADSGGFCLVTLGCNRYSGDVMPVGTIIDVFKGTPAEVMASGKHVHELVTAPLYDLMWVAVAGGATTDEGVKGIATPTDVIVRGGIAD